MKKTIAMLLVMILCIGMLAGCGGKKSGGEAPGKEESKGEIYDAGNVQMLVPEGWVAFPVMDIIAEDPNTEDPDSINICKDAKSEFDLLTKPSIQISYYGPGFDMMKPDKSWYENAEDVADMTIGKYTWTGFTADDFGGDKMAILWTEDGDHQYQAVVYLELSEGSVTLEDADVQAALGSVAPSGN